MSTTGVSAIEVGPELARSNLVLTLVVTTDNGWSTNGTAPTSVAPTSSTRSSSTSK